MSNQLAISTNPDWSHAQVALIQQQVAPGCTLPELELFGQICRKTGLDPFSRQIYAVSRGSGDRRKMTVQVSIDGFRLQAERSKRYGGSETVWCGEDGRWLDVWLSSDPPAAAKTTVFKTGCEKPFSAVALWSEYKQEVPEYVYQNGKSVRTGRMKLGDMWAKMPATMLAKCSEALALRKAFPAELSGLYTSEEMMQADAPAADIVVHQAPQDNRPKLPASAVVSETGDFNKIFGAKPKAEGPTEEEQALQAKANATPPRPTSKPNLASRTALVTQIAEKANAAQIQGRELTIALNAIADNNYADWTKAPETRLCWMLDAGWDAITAKVGELRDQKGDGE